MASRDVYDIRDVPPRGICLVINNWDFSGHHSEREGSEKDYADVARIFETLLGFKVIKKENQTKAEILATLEELQKLDHSAYSAFFVITMSHGDKGVVFTSDNEQIEINEMVLMFTTTKCPSLAGKPKIFLFQACQGVESMEAISVQSGLSGEASNACSGDAGSRQNVCKPWEESIPDVADILVGYAAISGTVAMRDVDRGTWYIQELCTALEQHCHEEDFFRILTVVTNRVSEKKSQGFTQMPCFTSKLRNLVYLRPIQARTNSLQRLIVTPSVLALTGQEVQEPESNERQEPLEPVVVINNGSHHQDPVSDTPTEHPRIERETTQPHAALPTGPRGMHVAESTNKSSNKTILSQSYDIGSAPRGYCFIIDNTNEFKSSQDKEINVSNQGIEDGCYKSEEVRLLEQKFGEKLGLYVETFQGLTRAGVHRILEAVSSTNNTRSCLVLIILSQGKHQAVYDITGKAIPIVKILKYFTRSFAEKPKIFLFHTKTTKSKPKAIGNRHLALTNAQPSHSVVVFTTADHHSNLEHIWEPLIQSSTSTLFNIGSQDRNPTAIVGNTSCIRYFGNSLQSNLQIHEVGQGRSQMMPHVKASILLSELEMLKEVWHHICSSTKELLTKECSFLHNEMKSVRQLRIVGASLSIMGTVVTIVGFGLLPVTLGASLGLTVGGSLTAISGALISSTASAYKIGLVHKKSKQYRDQLLIDAQLMQMIKHKQEELEEMERQCQQLEVSHQIRSAVVQLFGRGLNTTIRVGPVVAKIVAVTSGILVTRLGVSAARVSLASMRVLPIVGGVISLVTIPLDVADLAHACHHLWRGRENEIVKRLQNIVDYLEERLNREDDSQRSAEQLLELDEEHRQEVQAATEAQESEEELEDVDLHRELRVADEALSDEEYQDRDQQHTHTLPSGSAEDCSKRCSHEIEDKMEILEYDNHTVPYNIYPVT